MKNKTDSTEDLSPFMFYPERLLTPEAEVFLHDETDKNPPETHEESVLLMTRLLRKLCTR